MKKIFLFILPLVFIVVGCLQDNIDTYQVVPRTIYQPNAVYYKCGIGGTDLQILWNPPLADTQQNYKGYFIELFNSAPFVPIASDGIDSLLGPQIDSGQVLKIDTSYTFKGHGQIVQGGRYTVKVWGLRFPDPKNPDSLVKSQFPAELSFNYDSRIDSIPTQIFASSAAPNAINLFWNQSVSESNIGMAGYIIRYKDPSDNSAHVAYYTRIGLDTSTSQLINGKYYFTTVALQGFPSPPIEKPYMLWLKTVRKDSVESTDSIGIEWSGAERVPPTGLAVRVDTGIFIGQVSFQYSLVQTPNSPPQSTPQFQILQSNSNVVVSSLNGTMFSSTITQDTAYQFSLDRNFFAAPFADAVFTQSSVNFPNIGSEQGTIVYAKFKDNNRARIFFSKDSLGGAYIRSDSTVTIQASFQPIESVQLDYW